MPEYTYNSAPEWSKKKMYRETILGTIRYHERRLNTLIMSIANWDKGDSRYSYTAARDYDLRIKMLHEALEQAVAIGALRDVLDEYDKTFAPKEVPSYLPDRADRFEYESYIKKGEWRGDS